jgi:hypothetical protein
VLLVGGARCAEADGAECERQVASKCIVKYGHYFFGNPTRKFTAAGVPAVLQTAGLLILSRNVRHRLPFGRLFAVVEPQQ